MRWFGWFRRNPDADRILIDLFDTSPKTHSDCPDCPHENLTPGEFADFLANLPEGRISPEMKFVSTISSQAGLANEPLRASEPLPSLTGRRPLKNEMALNEDDTLERRVARDTHEVNRSRSSNVSRPSIKTPNSSPEKVETHSKVQSAIQAMKAAEEEADALVRLTIENLRAFS